MSEAFSLFSNTVKTIVEHLCKRQAILDFEPQIGSKVWQLIPVIRPSELKLEELKEHEAVKKCLDFMLRENFLKRLECNTDCNFLILLHLAYEYIKEFGCEFNEQRFKGLFDEMLSGEIIAVLENFEFEGAEEATIDKYRIRKLSELEIKQIIRLGYANSLGIVVKPDLGIIQNIWCIEAQSDVGEFLSVLRLFKRGYVSSSIILKMGKRFSHLLTRSYRAYSQSPKYVLKLDEVDSLRQLWNLYRRMKDKLPQELRIALKWFSKSYEEVEVENRILDLAIAFEIMFKDRRYDFLAQKLISSSSLKKKEIVKHLEKLRTERNFIVHQGRSNLRFEELEAVHLNAEEIFREFYRWFLEQIDEGKDYYEIIDKAKRYK